MEKSTLALLFLFGATAVCSAQQIERTFERTLSVSGPVYLDASTDSGGIEITAGPPGAVRIHGTLKAQNRWFGSGDVEERIRQLERNPPVYKNGSTVRVGVTDKSLLRGISMRLVIDAPAASQVRARADSGGIRVEGMKAPVDCKTDSGGIRARDIDGEVRAEADSGGIHIHGAKGPVYARADSGGIEALDIGGAIDVKTDSGGIQLSQTAAAPIHARADSGGATVRLASSGGYNIKVHSGSGRISVPEMATRGSVSRHEAEGKVRGGGALVDIQVDSGTIEVR